MRVHNDKASYDKFMEMYKKHNLHKLNVESKKLKKKPETNKQITCAS